MSIKVSYKLETQIFFRLITNDIFNKYIADKDGIGNFRRVEKRVALPVFYSFFRRTYHQA